MDETAKRKWQVRGAALALFLLGFAAGLLALNYVNAHRSGPGRDRYALMSERLNLTSEQKTEVERILSETRAQIHALQRESFPKMREVRAQADARLQSVLTPDQWREFQRLRSEGRGGGRRGRGGPGR